MPENPIEVSVVSWTMIKPIDEPGTRAELLRLLFGPAAPEDEEDADDEHKHTVAGGDLHPSQFR